MTAPLQQAPYFLDVFRDTIVGLPVMFKLNPNVYHRLSLLVDSAIACVALRSGDIPEAIRVRFSSH
jgi:hypothetical protein